MSGLLHKEGRKIWARRVKGFWEEFSHNKIGLVGIGILLFYFIVAVGAPWIAPYDPRSAPRVAEGFAPPVWMSIFPQYQNLPLTMDLQLDWTLKQGSEFVSVAAGREAILDFKGGTLEPVTVTLEASFHYPYLRSPLTFFLEYTYEAMDLRNTAHSYAVSVVSPGGVQYRAMTGDDTYQPTAQTIHLESTEYWWLKRLGLEASLGTNFAQMFFNETTIPGDVSLLFKVTFRSTSADAAGTVHIMSSRFFVPGLLHGALGTDHMGTDIFSQLVYGAGLSLAIGLIAAVLSTFLGVLVGVVSGYSGGTVDNIMMRMVDILLCLPVLPLLLALVFLFGKNVFYIVLLIGVFGWQGESRVIRSQVLALREASFVECAVASGGSKYYIMFKHIIPNVLPIALASLVLSVPGAILSEASLSFLGFGDPSQPTWGKMLNNAFGFGAFSKMAWWWAIPPGLAITLICLAFVFIGHAVDEVVNPKLRRRR